MSSRGTRYLVLVCGLVYWGFSNALLLAEVKIDSAIFYIAELSVCAINFTGHLVTYGGFTVHTRRGLRISTCRRVAVCGPYVVQLLRPTDSLSSHIDIGSLSFGWSITSR